MSTRFNEIKSLKKFTYLFLVWLNKTKVYNGHILRNALDNKPAAIPILTVSNHHSCFDDPGLWGEFLMFERGK